MAFKRFFFFHETLDQLKYKQMESSRDPAPQQHPGQALNSSEVFGAQGQGYSQEFHNLRQDAVGSSMYCPSLFFHLYLSLTSPFILSFQGSCLPSWSCLPFLEYRGVPQQGQEATGTAGTCPLPGHRGTGRDGWWSVGAESYGETINVSWKSYLGTLFCFMVFRKCSAMEEQFLWIKDSGPAAECVLWMPTSAVPGAFTSNAHKTEALISTGIVPNGPSCLRGVCVGCVCLILSPWSLHYLSCKEAWPCPDFVPAKRILQCTTVCVCPVELSPRNFARVNVSHLSNKCHKELCKSYCPRKN